MTRLSLRRTPNMEALENRQVLSVGTTAIEQYALEQLNRARMNPSQVATDVTTNLGRDTLMTFQYYNVDLAQTRAAIANEKPVAPLAWNGQLASAAQRSIFGPVAVGLTAVGLLFLVLPRTMGIVVAALCAWLAIGAAVQAFRGRIDL